MKHLGWKISFWLSWIPGLLLYGSFINCLKEGGGIALVGIILLLIPTILFLGLQILLGYFAYR